MIADILMGVLFLLGGAFTFVAGLGVLRLPDVLTRMHASTKAGTLGVSMVLIGAAAHFGDFAITAKAVLAILFILLTAPVAGHMMGRAAVRMGVPMWTGKPKD